MFTVERKHLPENRQKPLTREEMDARREAAKARLAAKAREAATDTVPDDTGPVPGKSLDPSTSVQTAATLSAASDTEEEAFIAFARVYSGTVRKGDSVYVLGPKHDPSILLEKMDAGQEINIVEGHTLKDLKAGCHVTKVTLTNIYLLMGRELCEMDEVPAGNMLGIGGLEDHVLKSATLSSTLACPSFSELLLMATPILRVALEPLHPGDLATLVRGLRMLNQADACVEVILQESGEHVLVTAGEVHLQRCLDDLRERYAKVEFSVSEPIVPFRETIIPPPLRDMINESIVPVSTHNEKKDQDTQDQQWVTVHTQDQCYRFRIQAIPLPEKVTQLLEQNIGTFKAYHKDKTKVGKKVVGVDESFQSLSISNDRVTDQCRDIHQSESENQSTCDNKSQVSDDNAQLSSDSPSIKPSSSESNQINPSKTTDNLNESTLPIEIIEAASVKPIEQSHIENSANQDSPHSSTLPVGTIEAASVKPIEQSHIENSANQDSPQSQAKENLDSKIRTTLDPLRETFTSPKNAIHDASLSKEMLRIRNELAGMLREEKREEFSEQDLDNIVSFGPRYCGPNILINCVQDLHHSIWPTPQPSVTSDPERLDHLSSVDNGFQLATLAGPLCEEPMMGVGFKLLEWSKVDGVTNSNNFYGPISGQIMTTVKEGCRKAFQMQPQRLMAAMYTCNIQVSSEVLGKVYAVLGRRHGRIVYNDSQNSVQAYLPVLESFSFAPEIRKSTSGLASPQLVFSHWEVINIDPYWEPCTEEEYLHFGDKADTENRARKYMNTVRKRKGLAVQENLVAHGEKQRTVKKNK